MGVTPVDYDPFAQQPKLVPVEHDPFAPEQGGPRKPVGAAMSVNNPPIQAQPEATGMPWASVPGQALRNLPASAGNFISNLVHPILHPVDTAKSVVALGDALGSKISRPGDFLRPGDAAPTPDQLQTRTQREAPADAMGEFFANRYGSVEGLKKTLATDPVGAAADASTVLTAGSTLPVRGAALAGKIGSVIDPLTAAGNVVKGTGKLADVIGSNTLGAATGAGARDIRAAGRAGIEGGEAGQAFRENIRGGEGQLSSTIDMAKSAVDKLRQERSDAYKAGKADLSKDKTVLDFQPVEDALANAHQVGSYKGVTVNRTAGKTMDEISSIVNEWKGLDPKDFHTPEGLDALKRTIGDLRDSTEFGTPARVAADRVYNAVKAEIQQQAPAYAKMMGDYAKASDQLKEVTKTFSLGEKASADTAQRKLQSASRNNVQTNYGERTKLIDVLAEHEPNLPYALAGQNLNALAPRGLVSKLSAAGGAMAGGTAAAMGAANPLSLALLTAASPRLVGEAVHAGGRAAGGVGNLAEMLAINAPNVRGAGQIGFQSGRADNIENRALARALMRANERRKAN